jgi:translation elongation factor EF-Ts
MGKQKLKRTKKDFESARDMLKQLGISESDKQDIFDMIEMDLKEYE